MRTFSGRLPASAVPEANQGCRRRWLRRSRACCTAQGLNADKYDRLVRISVLCGKVRADAWRRCSGVATVLQSSYEIRDAWMAEGYAWHGLPARLGKATLADALGDITASGRRPRCRSRRPSSTARGATRRNASVCTACSSRTAGTRIRSCTGRCASIGAAAGPM